MFLISCIVFWSSKPESFEGSDTQGRPGSTNELKELTRAYIHYQMLDETFAFVKKKPQEYFPLIHHVKILSRQGVCKLWEIQFSASNIRTSILGATTVINPLGAFCLRKSDKIQNGICMSKFSDNLMVVGAEI